uniref:RRM domain-containing protein n=1 Tax=Hyaloperonospora arabidopsidis (strain Emoy2) TaxID=559515 RepID=M4BRL9_HYAAE
MAPAAEDVLGELYAWDSVIEDDSALTSDDPQRDEDKTEDAYEQMIHTASGDASDVVLSLAAQLLHKHFFRFPHVQINVVAVLLQLCGPTRSQAVRIHTLRALLQIVKTPPAAAVASTPTAAACVARKNTLLWMQNINEAVQHTLDTEKSAVILRQVTPLRQALAERLPRVSDVPESSTSPSASTTTAMLGTSADLSGQNRDLSPRESTKQLREEEDAGDNSDLTLMERKAKLEENDAQHVSISTSTNKEGKIVQLNREVSSGDASLDTWKKTAFSGRFGESEGRRPKINAFSPRNCPPCPYLFLGSVPRHTPNEEIVEFLAPVWPAIDNMSVQIKQPDHNATAYAFVSMPSIEHAREAIHYVAANKFRGRSFLNANFARGPPVDTLLFVERTGDDVSMEDKGAVRDFDFSKCEPDVWDVLCQQLESFGPLAFAEIGCVRFRSSEHAKAAVRKQLFTVKGYEIYPVYDTKEQFAIDSTRRGSNVHSKQGFTLKSGRLAYRGRKNHQLMEDEDVMIDSGGRRGHHRVASSKYGERSHSPLPSGRGGVRVSSRSRSPEVRSGGSRYGLSMGGLGNPPIDYRLQRSRSRSPVPMSKKHALHDGGGYDVPFHKAKRREFRGKFGRRSPSPVDVRSHGSPISADELRGRPRERESPWVEPRYAESPRDRRGSREVGRGRANFRGASPSPSSSPRHSRIGDRGSRRTSDYKRGGPVEGGRVTHQRVDGSQEGRGRGHPPALAGGVLDLPHSLSPPRFGKYASGPSKAHLRSRSRSPHDDVRLGVVSNPRFSGRDERSLGNEVSDGHRSVQTERARYADDRSIAEVARDEQQERQRFFQQQQQSRRDFHDGNLSRYGTGRGGGRGGGRGRGDRYHGQQAYKGGRSGAMYGHDLPPPKGRSLSPLPPPAFHRSVSPPVRDSRRSPSPGQPPQAQHKSYSREYREEFLPRERTPALLPLSSPQLESSFNPGSVGPPGRDEFGSKMVDRMHRVPSRYERRHHSHRDRSRDGKGHRGHRDLREKRLSRAERSMATSPVSRDHHSVSTGRKSNVHSPRRSFTHRAESDNRLEEAAEEGKQNRSKKEDDMHHHEKEMKNKGARLTRDELFAGMDDLTVDYEEDDE